MSNIIEGGTGTGYKAAVNEYNELAVRATTKSEVAFSAERLGSSYFIANLDLISVTSGTSGILYLKYTGTSHLHIARIRTCGDALQKWRMYINPTGGTLISTATVGMNNNSNLTSPNILDATVYSGADTHTVTGGTMIDHWQNATGHSDVDYDGVIILGKNDSLAFTCEVSTAAEVCMRIIAFESED